MAGADLRRALRRDQRRVEHRATTQHQPLGAQHVVDGGQHRHRELLGLEQVLQPQDRSDDLELTAAVRAVLQVMILCNTASIDSSVGAGTSTNSGVPSMQRRYTPSRTRQCRWMFKLAADPGLADGRALTPRRHRKNKKAGWDAIRPIFRARCLLHAALASGFLVTAHAFDAMGACTQTGLHFHDVFLEKIARIARIFRWPMPPESLQMSYIATHVPAPPIARNNLPDSAL